MEEDTAVDAAGERWAGNNGEFVGPDYRVRVCILWIMSHRSNPLVSERPFRSHWGHVVGGIEAGGTGPYSACLRNQLNHSSDATGRSPPRSRRASITPKTAVFQWLNKHKITESKLVGEWTVGNSSPKTLRTRAGCLS